MITIEKELNRSVAANRKEFVQLVIDQEDEVANLLEGVRNEMSQNISDNSRDDKINDKDTIISNARDILKQYGFEFLNIMVAFNTDATQLVIDRDGAIVDRFNRLDYTTKFLDRADSVISKVETNFAARKFVTDGVSVGSRIKTIEKSYLSTVRNAIDVGINKGQSAEEIARQIDALIVTSPDKRMLSPFQLFREKFNFKVVQPDGPRGSISYNSLRIARTEISNTYRLNTILINKNQPWNNGFVWRLSSAHPKEDICDTYDGKTFKDEGDMPETHPNCMCRLEQIIKPLT